MISWNGFSMDAETVIRLIPPIVSGIIRVINSRVGLVLIFIAYTSSPWGLGAQIDAIKSNTAKLSMINDDLRVSTSKTYDLVVRMDDRCEYLPHWPKETDRTAVLKIQK